MIDIISGVDIVKGLREIYDRYRASDRIAGRTRYVLERARRVENDVNAFSDSSVTTDPPFHDTFSLPVHTSPSAYHALYEQHKDQLVPEPPEQQSRIADFHRIVQKTKLALRRDEIETICSDIERLQNDYFIDSLVVGQAETHAALKRLEFLVTLKSCNNIEGAKRLLQCPYIELDGLPYENEKTFGAIYKLDHNGRPVPIWGVGEPAPELFANDFGYQRFAVILAVATALSTAHSVKWYHRHLSARDIVILRDLRETKDTVAALGSSRYARVLNFRCPVTGGCFNGCSTCKKSSLDPTANRELGKQLDEARDNISFSAAHDNPYADGEGADMLSLAALVLWIYSGHKMTTDYDPFDSSNEYAIACVPWPLRWLITDYKLVSAPEVLVFLQAIHERRIKPHLISHVLIRTPTSNPTSDDDKLTHALYQCSLRCALMGTRTEEPEAAIHLGMLWEAKARYDIGRGGVNLDDGMRNIANALEYAYFCYDGASKLGEGWGFVHMAKLQAEWLSNRLPCTPDGVSHASMLYLLLEAATCQNSHAIAALSKVPKNTVHFPDQLFSGSQDEAYTYRAEACLEAVLEIGKCWRRGLAGLPVDIEQSRAWLQVASRQNLPGATLELGLLTVQMARTSDDMREGVDLVGKASFSQPAPAGLQACFWLGFWHHTELYWRPVGQDQEIVVQRDDIEAARYFEIASNGGVAEAMAFYSRFLRNGIGPIRKDKAAAEEWNRKARKMGSATAYYGYAQMRIDEAQKVYASIYRRGHNSHNITIPATSTGDLSAFLRRAMVAVTPLRRSRHENICRRHLPKTKRTSVFGERLASIDFGNITRRTSVEERDFRDPHTGKHKPVVIEQLLENAMNSLSRPRSIFPGEACNPLPSYMAASRTLRNLEMWAKCASSVQQGIETRDAFCSRKRNDAYQLLQEAASMNIPPLCERWRKERVNYIHQDLEVIRAAKKKLEELESPHEFMP